MIGKSVAGSKVFTDVATLPPLRIGGVLVDYTVYEQRMSPVQEHTLLVKAAAKTLGFERVAIADATVPLDKDFAHYLDYVREGLHGPLAYMARNQHVRERLDHEEILLGAQSIVMLLARYDRPDRDNDPPLSQGVAQYARGADYHDFLRAALRKLADVIRSIGPSVVARPMIDTAPVLERAWARRAGLGFVGKNGLLITPGVGSFTLIGEVVTSLALEMDSPIEERCGSCTRCLDACPTEAFIKPYVLDAGKCVSTLTIETDSPVLPALRDAVSKHLFGCDICQDVCPFNAKKRSSPSFSEHFQPSLFWQQLSLHQLACLGMPGAIEYKALLKKTPLSRVGLIGLARTACMMLKHMRDEETRELLERITKEHPSDVVRDAAQWSLSSLVLTREYSR